MPPVPGILTSMDVAITGSSGLIGTALRESLGADGHRVVRVVRHRSDEPDTVWWNVKAGEIDAAGLEGVDAVVHLAGESIGTRRWNEGHKARVLSSRVRGTQILSKALASLDDGPRALVSASAIGYYGPDRGDEVLTEEKDPGKGFLAELCRHWEDATAIASDAGVRVVNIRSGLVLSRRGGLLPLMLLPFRLGLGGPLGDGTQYMSWIALDDEVRAIRHLIDADVSGPANLTSPEPVTNAGFTRVLGEVLRRPTFIRVPAFALRLAFGREMADETVLAGQRARPERLTDSGFSFEHPVLSDALGHVLGKGPLTAERRARSSP